MLDDAGGYPANSDQRSDWRFVICRKPPATGRKIEQFGDVFPTVNFEWNFRLRDSHKRQVTPVSIETTAARNLSNLLRRSFISRPTQRRW
jgi:hypothetical protein